MSHSLKYKRCIEELYGLQRFGIVLGLETMTGLLNALGNPHLGFRTVHVAGTNGKGSVAATLASILSCCSHKTGLYTSPHLVRFNERFKINGSLITDEDLLDAYEAVKRVKHRVKRPPTFFEYATVMALYYFAKQKVDIAIIETGMGGRLDATNMISPLLSVITNISLEHKKYLGNRIKDIAFEKAGIIKPSTPVIAGARQRQARQVIDTVAKNRNAPLFLLGKDFKIRRNRNGSFNYYGIRQNIPGIKPALKGDIQFENTAMAMAAAEILMDSLKIDEPGIREGISKTRWPGRIEVVSKNPLVIIDGAHNLAASKTLADFLKRNTERSRLTLVIGILDDKPYKKMLANLLPCCSRLILTRPSIDRALSPEILFEASSTRLKEIRIIPGVKDAVTSAVTEAEPGSAICIAGSLYVVGEAIPALEALKRAGVLLDLT